MIENRCYACYSKLEEGKADCGVCGMTSFKVVGDNKEAADMIKKLGDEYRAEKLKGITISLVAYEYENAGGKLREKASHKMKLMDAGELRYQETIWNDENYATIETDRAMDLDLVIDGKTSKNVKLQFKAPKLDDFWHVGICMKEGFEVFLKIGNEKNFVETESFSII